MEISMPQKICKDCISKLDGIKKLADLALKNNETLRKFLKSQNSEIKISNSKENTLQEFQNISNFEQICDHHNQQNKHQLEVLPSNKVDLKNTMKNVKDETLHSKDSLLACTIQEVRILEKALKEVLAHEKNEIIKDLRRKSDEQNKIKIQQPFLKLNSNVNNLNTNNMLLYQNGLLKTGNSVENAQMLSKTLNINEIPQPNNNMLEEYINSYLSQYNTEANLETALINSSYSIEGCNKENLDLLTNTNSKNSDNIFEITPEISSKIDSYLSQNQNILPTLDTTKNVDSFLTSNKPNFSECLFQTNSVNDVIQKNVENSDVLASLSSHENIHCGKNPSILEDNVCHNKKEISNLATYLSTFTPESPSDILTCNKSDSKINTSKNPPETVDNPNNKLKKVTYSYYKNPKTNIYTKTILHKNPPKKTYRKRNSKIASKIEIYLPKCSNDTTSEVSSNVNPLKNIPKTKKACSSTVSKKAKLNSELVQLNADMKSNISCTDCIPDGNKNSNLSLTRNIKLYNLSKNENEVIQNTSDHEYNFLAANYPNTSFAQSLTDENVASYGKNQLEISGKNMKKIKAVQDESKSTHLTTSPKSTFYITYESSVFSNMPKSLHEIISSILCDNVNDSSKSAESSSKIDNNTPSKQNNSNSIDISSMQTDEFTLPSNVNNSGSESIININKNTSDYSPDIMSEIKNSADDLCITERMINKIIDETCNLTSQNSKDITNFDTNNDTYSRYSFIADNDSLLSLSPNMASFIPHIDSNDNSLSNTTPNMCNNSLPYIPDDFFSPDFSTSDVFPKTTHSNPEDKSLPEITSEILSKTTFYNPEMKLIEDLIPSTHENIYSSFLDTNVKNSVYDNKDSIEPDSGKEEYSGNDSYQDIDINISKNMIDLIPSEASLQCNNTYNCIENYSISNHERNDFDPIGLKKDVNKSSENGVMSVENTNKVEQVDIESNINVNICNQNTTIDNISTKEVLEPNFEKNESLSCIDNERSEEMSDNEEMTSVGVMLGNIKNVKKDFNYLRQPPPFNKICKYCQEKFNRNITLQNHIRIKHNINNCYKCKLEFVNKNEYDMHIKSYHTIVCKFCNKSILNGNLKPHIEKQHQNLIPSFSPVVCDANYLDKVECLICSNILKSQKAVKNHYFWQHQVYACDVCLELFLSTVEHAQHMKEIHAIPCLYCAETFYTSRRYKRHVSKAHKKQSVNKVIYNHKSDNDLFECNFCKKGIRNKIIYKRHVFWSHSKYACSICLEAFATEELEQEHFETHGFVCILCRIKYDSKLELSKHCTDIHPDFKPFICEHCGFSFKKRKELVEHKRKHKLVKSHLCSICGKVFKTYALLYAHSLNHKTKEEKKYMCNICDRKFYFKSQLKKHKSSHTLKKSFKCNDCKKYFATSFLLELHILRHLSSIQRNYTCHFCNLSYVKKLNLELHMKKHLNE